MPTGIQSLKGLLRSGGPLTLEFFRESGGWRVVFPFHYYTAWPKRKAVPTRAARTLRTWPARAKTEECEWAQGPRGRFQKLRPDKGLECGFFFWAAAAAAAATADLRVWEDSPSPAPLLFRFFTGAGLRECRSRGSPNPAHPLSKQSVPSLFCRRTLKNIIAYRA